VDRCHHRVEQRVRLGDGPQTVELAGVVHAELGDHPRDPLRPVAQLRREAGLGVAASSRKPDLEGGREKNNEKLLGRGLAEGAGDRSQPVRGCGPLVPGETLKRSEGVWHHELREFDRHRAPHQRCDRARSCRLGNKLVAVHPLAWQCHEEVPRSHRA